jgi:hypothetical protein
MASYVQQFRLADTGLATWTARLEPRGGVQPAAELALQLPPGLEGAPIRLGNRAWDGKSDLAAQAGEPIHVPTLQGGWQVQASPGCRLNLLSREGAAWLVLSGPERLALSLDFRGLFAAHRIVLQPDEQGRTEWIADIEGGGALRQGRANEFVYYLPQKRCLGVSQPGVTAQVTWDFVLPEPRPLWIEASHCSYGSNWVRLLKRTPLTHDWVPVSEFQGKPYDYRMEPRTLLSPAEGRRFELRLEVSEASAPDNGLRSLRVRASPPGP